MADDFEYVSRARLRERDGMRTACLGEAPEPSSPACVASTLDPVVAAVAGRALAVHPEGCPAHLSVQGAIGVTWDASVQIGGERISLRG